MKNNDLLFKGFAPLVKKSPVKKSPLPESPPSEESIDKIECCNANTMVTMPDGAAYYK